jgi:sialidase-1
MAMAMALAGSALAARGAALFETAQALVLPKGDHGYRGINGDFVQLKDGSILWSYTCEGQGLMAMRSTDQGKTWSAGSVLIPWPKPPAQGRTVHPSLLRLKNGNILLSYIYSTHPTTPYYGHNYYRLSADEGKSWTDQYVLTPHPGYVIMHNDRLVQLSSGRILAIAEYKAHLPSSDDHSGYAGISFFSDDQGYSWQVSKNIVDMAPTEFQEPGAVELKDGRVLMVGRTYSGFPVKAYSSDGGETWGKGEKMEGINMPYAGLPTLKRIPSTGDLLFIWISERSEDKVKPQIKRRCALTAAISKDDGLTFENQRHIARDPEDDFGYQCVTFLPDHTALIGYHARTGLFAARIGIDWFYGK